MNKALGFTLVEILLAILIFSIIGTTIYGSFHSVIGAANMLEGQIENKEMAQTCLLQMVVDLQSIYVHLPPEYKPPEWGQDPEPYRFVGATQLIETNTMPILRFASMSQVLLEGNTKKDIVAITYYVHSSSRGFLELRRKEQQWPYPPFEVKTSDPVLCQNIKSLSFRYYNSEGTVFDAWDSESDQVQYATPVRVDINLEIGQDDQTFSAQTQIQLPVYREPWKESEGVQ